MVVSIKFPIDEIGEGIKAAREAKSQIMSIDNELKKYGTEEEARKLRGEDGVKERARAIERGNQQKAAIIAEAREKLSTLHMQATAAIDEQTTPNGNDIIGENAGDFALLTNGLIESSEKLKKILEKHDNTAFRYAAQRYAAQRNAEDPAGGWTAFNFFENAPVIREYTNSIFDRLNDAAANPYGIAAMQYTETPNEYGRIAAEYGLTDEFYASGGERLNEV